ncbi:MAG: alpha/beta fold hydrolase [Acidobacteria bacterium]|nr:alpha/beta fold hydrolase [Acidobacteriota bacterium]MDA1234539.1 alpha/beta fold hydrolase [Acidobacteriota bacterium]
MKHYLLVHGAWEGSWSWEDTTPILESPERTVTVVDLPGSYGNKQPISEVTMASYVQTVADATRKLDHEVILVGHILGGAVISQVAELIPQKIERLVYVAAFLLENGDSVIEAMQRDPAGEFLPQLAFSDDQSYVTASEQTLRDVAFHDVEEKTIQPALARMAERQATEPFVAKAVVSDERFGSVPKTFIRTDLDKMVTPALQEEMLGNWKVDQVHRLRSGHFPTLSMPEELADVLSLVGRTRPALAEPIGDAAAADARAENAAEVGA